MKQVHHNIICRWTSSLCGATGKNARGRVTTGQLAAYVWFKTVVYTNVTYCPWRQAHCCIQAILEGPISL